MKVLAGEFKNKRCYITTKHMVVEGFFSKEKIPLADFVSVEAEGQESRTSGGLGAAAAGGLLFGGVGAIAGAVIGRGTKTEIRANIALLDGRRFLAKLSGDDLDFIRAALFEVEGKTLEQRRAESGQRKIKQKRNETIVAWIFLLLIAAGFLVYASR